MGRCTFCHHEMMLLVMRADGHQSEEPKTLYLVGIAINEEGNAVTEHALGLVLVCRTYQARTCCQPRHRDRQPW